MNIAIFTPNQNPYSETFIQAHKNYLKGNIFYYYGKGNNIQLEGKKDLVSNFKRKGLKLYAFLFRKGKNYIAKSRIIISLKQNNIEAVLVEYGVHAHHLLPFIKATNLPMVVHFHGYDASRYETVNRCNKYKEVFHYASKVVVVSKIMKQMILDLGCPNEKIVYNVYGPQPEFEKVKPTFIKKQFIAIGRFTDKKAPYYTILAFKKVLKKHPETTLLIGGDGILYNVCKNLIRVYNLEDNVKLLGVIDPEEYRKHLSESLAFVQHSIRDEEGDMEGTPLAVLEASSAGIPVISTFHAGIPDVIQDNRTGLCCKLPLIRTVHSSNISTNLLFLILLGLAPRELNSAYFTGGIL
ncbi:glycosyltransferase, partial [Aequorivita todarodis]|uniref:glycosyltransferase n=1 Tax=Aequorivita todarodis TaxID=2036821 RepID=UPI003AF3215C